jgi:aminoglycoside phosphotransferase (APT) family kinase protein
MVAGVTDATDSTASFSAAAAEGVMFASCQVAGLDYSGARLLRLGENALFHLPAEAVVVRIARTMDYWRDVVKELSVSRWLAGASFPAARVHQVAGQPLEVSGHPVTFWQFINGREGSNADIATLGKLLHRLHGMPRPAEFELPGEEILGRVSGRIERSPVAGPDKEFFLRRFHELAEQVSVLRYPLPPGPTHGDAHTGNLMFCDGGPVLIDFERFAWGHPEWDLSMTATEYLTAGWWTDAEYSSFAEAYGYDVTSWAEGFPVLRAVHEVKMTTWLMQNVGESPDIAREYETRLRTIRGEAASPWRPF